MSEFLEKLIDEKGKEVKEETLADINEAATKATERFNRFVEDLKQKAKIILPVNILDILAKGGKVDVFTHTLPGEAAESNDYWCYSLTVGDLLLTYALEVDRLNRLKAGKYRITVIFEKI